MKRTHRFGSLFVLLILFAVNCSAQSLADIARRERARQNQVRSGVNITSVPQGAAATTAAGTSSAPTSAAAAPAAKPNAPAGPTDNKGRDEKFWRDAFQKARADQKRAEDKAAVIELRLREQNTQLQQNNDVIYNRDYRMGAQITDTQKELEIARKDVEQAKQKISELEEDLRRSNGLPGWAR